MKTKYSKQLLESLVNKNKSFAGVMKQLGLQYSGGNHKHIKDIIKYYEISTSHFKGQGWNKGLALSNKRKTPKEYLILHIKNKTPQPYKTKTYLLRDKIKERKCERCHNTDWQGHPIPIELHHKNGNKLDDRIENLELLCPNCHAFTKNYRGKVKKVEMK